MYSVLASAFLSDFTLLIEVEINELTWISFSEKTNLWLDERIRKSYFYN